jgi:putative membrane protein insertion efficiency factor
MLSRVIATGIRAYQMVLSPVLPPACRFAPSCSEYARQAVLEHGACRGGWLAVRRLLRCHPFGAGGYDPPPAGVEGKKA